MQIVEVKNSIAKVFYNPAENNLLPSDFILIDDNSQKVIAQVIDIETTENFKNTLAVIRLALFIDKDENLSYYNGYIPSKHSKLFYINPDEITELIKASKDNIYFGNLSNHNESYVKTGFSIIDEKLYIRSDKSDKTAIAVKNLVSELSNYNKKSIILDFNGQYSDLEGAVKLKISDNLKLPLNKHAFDTILEYDVTDCPIQDRALIQSIVLELREYLKTVRGNYIPFNTFKSIVENEFTSNPVSGLMLLRNKLWFYSQENIFADTRKQFDVIDNLFLKNNTILIDASEVSEKWYKLIIKTISELVNQECYLFVSLNDVSIDKKSLLKLYNKKNITPIISTTYDSPYKNLLKSICHNQLLLKPSIYINEQEFYCSLVNKMNTDEFILFGETTLYLPMLMELKLFDNNTVENVIQNDIKKDVDKFLSPQNTVISKRNPDISSINTENEEEQEEFSEADLDFLDELEEENKVEEEQLVQENQDIPKDEIVEQNIESEVITEEEQPVQENQDTQKDEINEQNIEPEVITEEEITENSEEDINSIDDVIDKIENSIPERLENDDISKKQEEITPEEKPLEEPENIEINEDVIPPPRQEIPVYETHKEPVNFNMETPFKIGDKVYHPKHGKGVIEGFANYSNKILFCQINFENVGRRIMDPTVSGLEKIS